MHHSSFETSMHHSSFETSMHHSSFETSLHHSRLMASCLSYSPGTAMPIAW
jgi:hypothetical protein